MLRLYRNCLVTSAYSQRIMLPKNVEVISKLPSYISILLSSQRIMLPKNVEVISKLPSYISILLSSQRIMLSKNVEVISKDAQLHQHIVKQLENNTRTSSLNEQDNPLLKINVKNRMLLARLAVAKTVKKFLAIHGFRWFSAVLLCICHWNAFKTKYTCSMCLRTQIHFITVLPTMPMLPKMSFPFRTDQSYPCPGIPLLQDPF